MSEGEGSRHEAALIIPVPEIEPYVQDLRLQHDPSAGLGVPAHITINYPFNPEPELTDGLIDQLARHFRRFQAFDFAFKRVARFPDVVYLPPEPETPFTRIIASVSARFPESPPYGGVFDDVKPHLTVAQSVDRVELRDVEERLAERLSGKFPIGSRARTVRLIDSQHGVWETRAEFPLG